MDLKSMWRRLSFRIVVIITSALVVLLGGIIMTIDRAVSQFAAPFCYASIETVPANDVGLLLGTAKFTRSGNVNAHYANRISACEHLFKAGKIRYVLVSGDNSRKTYDEPTTFKLDLVARGIPAERIYLDYAGFRTLDSVVRAREVFGQARFTVISQRFHNERAVYLARKKGIEAIGFDARDVSVAYGFKTKLREKLARTVAECDLYLFGTDPKFLGPKIAISDANPAK